VEKGKHTPGPWIIKLRMGAPIVRAGDVDICAPEIRRFSQHDGGIEERIANARLIAAAPALLEALRGMLEAFPAPKIRAANGFSGNLAHAVARAAIAQAEQD